MDVEEKSGCGGGWVMGHMVEEGKRVRGLGVKRKTEGRQNSKRRSVGMGRRDLKDGMETGEVRKTGGEQQMGVVHSLEAVVSKHRISQNQSS